jgi:hypothetical protein
MKYLLFILLILRTHAIPIDNNLVEQQVVESSDEVTGKTNKQAVKNIQIAEVICTETGATDTFLVVDGS